MVTDISLIDEFSSRKRQRQAASGVHEAVVRAIGQRFSSFDNVRVLDAPCGRGTLSEFLASHGAQVDGFDITPPAPENPTVSYHAVDLETCDAPAGTYDLILSVEGIEHLYNPAAWVARMTTMLKPGGWLILSTPNPDSLSSRFKVFSRGYYAYFRPEPGCEDMFRESGHIHPIDFTFVEWCCRRNGLSIEAIETKSDPLPRWLARILYRMFYSRFPRMIMPLIRGEVGIYSVHKA